MTMSALLGQLSREAVGSALMEQGAAQMNHMREAGPDEWAGYVHEGAAWEEGTIEHPGA